MLSHSSHVQQHKINHICSYLTAYKIRTTADLIDEFDSFLNDINQYIFKSHYKVDKCLALLSKAIKTFNDVNTFTIKLPDYTYCKLSFLLQTKLKDNLGIEIVDDLTRVTKNYDRLIASKSKKSSINNKILKLVTDKTYIDTKHVIIGAGDTGVTLWLEKYNFYHNKAESQLKNNQLPPLLIIADDTGSWKHNYTLAQTHSSLERTTSKSNAYDYMPNKLYQQNPHANARHVYQSNQVNLAETTAPLLKAKLLKIEKSLNHKEWHVLDYDYRLVVESPAGTKLIYSNDINICTGLGPAKNIMKHFMNDDMFNKLNQIDPVKKYTPIIDGNQFILTGTEESVINKRRIVIYGGGGTAAACYRKGFFGHDVRTENLPFLDTLQKNNIIWIARQFNKAGTGKLATNALTSAMGRHELLQGDLIEIIVEENNSLKLIFKNFNKIPCLNGADTIEIKCDQFVFSVGQDDSIMRNVCEEVDAELTLNYDKTGMLINAETFDHKIKFFGAAAMAARENEYLKSTWDWLQSENIGGDVGPGSMPPSRAQIKRYNQLNGIVPESINANIDSHYMITDYLVNAGAPADKALAFVTDLLNARKYSTAGCTHAMLQNLFQRHSIEGFDIYGHVFIVSNDHKNENMGNLSKNMQSNTIHSFYTAKKTSSNNVNNSFFKSIAITHEQDEDSYIDIDLNKIANINEDTLDKMDDVNMNKIKLGTKS